MEVMDSDLIWEKIIKTPLICLVISLTAIWLFHLLNILWASKTQTLLKIRVPISSVASMSTIYIVIMIRYIYTCFRWPHKLHSSRCLLIQQQQQQAPHHQLFVCLCFLYLTFAFNSTLHHLRSCAQSHWEKKIKR